jgi:hypothetical protein
MTGAAGLVVVVSAMEASVVAVAVCDSVMVVSRLLIISATVEASMVVVVVTESVLRVSTVVKTAVVGAAVVVVDLSGRHSGLALAAGSSAAPRTVAKDVQRMMKINESDASVGSRMSVRP